MDNLKCSACGEDLLLDAKGRIVPCKECLAASYEDGLDEGGISIYDHHELIKNIYKKGYEDCYMVLTKEYASEWVLRFAAEDAGFKG